MANLYVGSDGVIHSGNGNGVQGAVSVTTSPAERLGTNESGSTYCSRDNANYVSSGRKVFYWLFTLVAGFLIGVGIYELIGKGIFTFSDVTTTMEGIEKWFYSLAPNVFVIGGCGGSIWYGVSFAKRRSYDLGAIVLAMLSAVGGIVVFALALAVICFVVALIVFILKILLVIIIAVGVIAGLCEG
ncbi:hypothetical protein H6A03_07185 [[Clostridium] spiroforme]|nr:hypothetical protein [Thomasclavelia spiroformis]MBM6879567.1 hypothetical protein [Thomasclavelia spiroformis]